MIKVNLL